MQIDKLHKIYVLTKKKFFKFYQNSNKKIFFVDSLNSIKIKNNNNILISCNTNIIVPKEVFNNFKLALNIHPGSYYFPGRDPHHWACYLRSNIFGATVHLMTEKVDSGDIIDFELQSVKNILSISEYKNIGSKTSKILMMRILNGILRGNIKEKKKKWSGRVTKRIDLIKLCDFRNLELQEVKRREISLKGFEKFFRY